MPLAGNQDHVLRSRKGAGSSYGRPAVGNGLEHRARRNPRDDVRDDLFGILGTGIVTGNDQMIGRRRGPAHPGTLGFITIAARAEDAEEPARRQRTQSGDDVGESVVGVGEVDDDPCAGFAVADEDDREVRGLFLTNYFSPPDDVRRDDPGRTVVVSRAYPVSAWFDWLRTAGFAVERLCEPPALPPSETPPYTSDAWAEPDGELDAIPGTLILVAVRPGGVSP